MDTFGDFLHDITYFETFLDACMYAPLSHILEVLITTYREKESAMICFDGSIAF